MEEQSIEITFTKKQYRDFLFGEIQAFAERLEQFSKDAKVYKKWINNFPTSGNEAEEDDYWATFPKNLLNNQIEVSKKYKSRYGV